MVARLKQQVQDLKDELSMATGEERTDELTDEEKAEYATFPKLMEPTCIHVQCMYSRICALYSDHYVRQIPL